MHKSAGKAQSAAGQTKMLEVHKPSAFEGAVWAAQGITDARLIYHAPPGCYLMQHMGALCNEWHPDFYSTLVSYSDVMRGAGERLDAVIDMVAQEKPRAIIVITSPVIEITMDDVSEQSLKGRFDRIVVVRPSLGGTLAEGKESVFLGLMSLMNPALPRHEKSVNLVGPTYNTFNWRADVFELTRMLAATGITVNAVLTADCTVEEIERAPAAALNVCLYPYDCGVEFAKKMQERFGIPYTAEHMPIGFRKSAAWLSSIARFFGIDASAYISKEIRSARDFTTSLLVPNTLFESSVALSTDNCDTYSVGIATFLHREMGMQIAMASVATPAAAEALEGICSSVLLNPTIDEKKSLFLEASPTIILGNYYDLKLSTDLGFKNFLYADIPLIGYIFSENNPFMGFMGAKNLVQSIGNEIYTKIFIETKGEMEGPISSGEVAWELDAERALGRMAELLPHFIRSIAIKKMHQVADSMALEQRSTVTLDILKHVADKYTPTRFKSKYATIFTDMKSFPDAAPAAGPEPIFEMPWDDEAKALLEMVPPAFLAEAVRETEKYARENSCDRVTGAVADAYRKKLGF